jgi:hypothetical protein
MPSRAYNCLSLSYLRGTFPALSQIVARSWRTAADFGLPIAQKMTHIAGELRRFFY